MEFFVVLNKAAVSGLQEMRTVCEKLTKMKRRIDWAVDVTSLKTSISVPKYGGCHGGRYARFLILCRLRGIHVL